MIRTSSDDMRVWTSPWLDASADSARSYLQMLGMNTYTAPRQRAGVGQGRGREPFLLGVWCRANGASQPDLGEVVGLHLVLVAHCRHVGQEQPQCLKTVALTSWHENVEELERCELSAVPHAHAPRRSRRQNPQVGYQSIFLGLPIDASRTRRAPSALRPACLEDG